MKGRKFRLVSAAPGAIERIRIDKDTLEPRFRVIGVDQWSDEDGFDAAVAKTGITGICGSGIIEVLGEMYLAEVITADGVIDGANAAKSNRIESDGRTFAYRISDTVSVTQMTCGQSSLPRRRCMLVPAFNG